MIMMWALYRVTSITCSGIFIFILFYFKLDPGNWLNLLIDKLSEPASGWKLRHLMCSHCSGVHLKVPVRDTNVIRSKFFRHAVHVNINLQVYFDVRNLL